MDERKHGDLVRRLIEEGLVTAVHDLSDGGLAVALAEMALASGHGVTLDRAVPHTAAALFGEDQGRYVIATNNGDPVVRAMAKAGVKHVFLGSVSGDAVLGVAFADLRAANEAFFPDLMNA